MLLLSRNDVMKILDMADCIKAVEKAFAELDKGTALLPLRTTIPTADGTALFMPAYLKESGALACKVVSAYKNNPQKHNLPTIMAKVVIQDPETGDVTCMMDGAYLTAVRTGAVSAVATKYLARTAKGQTVGIFGAGVQARTQLWAMTLVRDVSQAYVYDISEQAANQFITEMSRKLNLKVIKAESPDQILEEADIICTASSSAKPIFDGSKVRMGTHINGIGSHSPNARELDTVIIKRSRIVADSYEACLKETGDIMIPIQEGAIDRSHLYAELGELINGKKPGRANDKEITLFKSNGLAIQDAAAAKLVYDKALQLGIGTEIKL